MIRRFRDHIPSIPGSCFIEPSAQVIGDVTLGERSSIWFNAVVRGDVHTIRIGNETNIQDCAVLHGMRNLYSVTLGDRVTVGHNATVHGCTVADDVLIGIGAIILNGARIGSGSIIAAGAVVPERMLIPPRSLVAGVPASVRRMTTDEDVHTIRKYAANYVEYVALYLHQPDPGDHTRT